jgi:hypothetical protein
MKLFMIRLQNGNSRIIQAKNSKAAIRKAELHVDGKDYVDDFNEGQTEKIDAAEMHLALVSGRGIGKQNYTIRELQNFDLECSFEDDGILVFTPATYDSSEEIFEDYPVLGAAIDSLEEYVLPLLAEWEEQGGFKEGIPRERTQYEVDTVKDGAERERVRLLAIG